jgi:hypothetical protein
MRGTGRRADDHRMSADERGARTQALAINDYPKRVLGDLDGVALDRADGAGRASR